MEIDIRTMQNSEKITEIRFSDAEGDIVALGGVSREWVYIANDDSGQVLLEDIPNLIKALEMAMGLWGKSDE